MGLDQSQRLYYTLSLRKSVVEWLNWFWHNVSCFCIILVLLSRQHLPHSQINKYIYSDLRSADSSNEFWPYVAFTGFSLLCLCVIVSQLFDKHLYMTSWLNYRNHSTYTYLPQNRLYCAKLGILHYLSRSPNTSTSGRCHNNHHNNILKCMISVIILTGKMSYWFCL